MSKRSILFSILALVGLTGCIHSNNPHDLLMFDKAYQVEWLGERPLMDYSHLTLTFEENGRAFGNGGCNHWFGQYRFDKKKLSFSHIGSTRKLCTPALMEQERRFLDMLEVVNRWDIAKTGELRLWTDRNQPIKLLPEHN